jgi:hypothetical protein
MKKVIGTSKFAILLSASSQCSLRQNGRLMKPPYPGKHTSLTNPTSSKDIGRECAHFDKNQGLLAQHVEAADCQQESQAADSSYGATRFLAWPK